MAPEKQGEMDGIDQSSSPLRLAKCKDAYQINAAREASFWSEPLYEDQLLVNSDEEESAIPNSARVVGTSKEDSPSSHLPLHAAEYWRAVGSVCRLRAKDVQYAGETYAKKHHDAGGNKHGNGVGELEKQRRLGAGKQCDVAVSGGNAGVDADQREMRGGAGLQMLHAYTCARRVDD
ncbi:hypothetical protein C8R44DRAFT_724443 [Mycena epipterygia]|nr:hypothetical protein C8R44DRAFT_724443 [Mycena epipterygia]